MEASGVAKVAYLLGVRARLNFWSFGPVVAASSHGIAALQCHLGSCREGCEADRVWKRCRGENDVRVGGGCRMFWRAQAGLRVSWSAGSGQWAVGSRRGTDYYRARRSKLESEQKASAAKEWKIEMKKN